jgi:hypothetical protein
MVCRCLTSSVLPKAAATTPRASAWIKANCQNSRSP